MRRMISLFNTIVRRGHVPREASIRRLMESIGLTIEANADGAADDADNASEASTEAEDAESSVATNDECVEEIPSNLAASYQTGLVSMEALPILTPTPISCLPQPR